MATDFNPALSSRFIALSCRYNGRPSWISVHQILHNLMVVTQESTWRSYLKFSSEAIIPDLLRSRSNVRQKLMLHLNIGGPTENIGETVGYDVSYRQHMAAENMEWGVPNPDVLPVYIMYWVWRLATKSKKINAKHLINNFRSISYWKNNVCGNTGLSKTCTQNSFHFFFFLLFWNVDNRKF